MNIAVLGANGRSGKIFVNQALKRGHKINAGTHRQTQYYLENSNLSIIQCDAANLGDIRKLVKDQDAVISLIGHVKGSVPDIQTQAIKNIIKAMEENSIKRLISLSGTGIRIDNDNITFMDRILNESIKLIDPQRIKDGVRHYELLKQSNLDWTLLRVLKLQNSKQKAFRLTFNGPAKTIVSRQETAEALINILEQGLFIKKTPIISPIKR